MNEFFKVDPWKIEGKVDYDKLIKEFGVNKIDNSLLKKIEGLSLKNGFKLHLYLRRGLFFAHRDFDKIFNNEKVFLYTGRAPGGVMHIGHLVPFFFTKYLQNLFSCNLYIQIPDEEKFLFKKELSLDDIEEKVKSDLLDIASIGFDLDKTFIFRNSEYISHFYKLSLKISKKITFSTAKAVFGFSNESNIGMINYPSLQIAPTFFEDSSCIVPCGIDQDPYFRLQRDIANSLGFKKVINIHSKFLPSLTGVEGKMSASDNSKAILLTDPPEIVKKKINKYAFSGGGATLDEHRKYGGDPDIDVSFIWLYYLFEDDDKKIMEIRNQYSKGELLSGELKNILINKINEFLKKHNENKEKVIKENLLDKYMYSGKLARRMWNNYF